MIVYEPCLMLKPEMITGGDTARIDSFVKIEGGQGVTIGEGTHVPSFCHLNIGGGKLTVGAHVAMSSGTKIITGTATTEAKSMSASSPSEWQKTRYTHVVIGDFVFLGTNCIIFPGVTIGDRAVIGAGAVITHDVPPDEVWIGNPAHKLRDR